MRYLFVSAMLVALAGLTLPAAAQSKGKGGEYTFTAAPDDVDFGDNASKWAFDGECDDPRFTGKGAFGYNNYTDMYHDADDCRAAYQRGELQLTPENAGGGRSTGSGMPDFGSDAGQWTHDGECDDPRFEGPGMASTLLDDDLYADASDCRAAFQSGTIRLAGGRGIADSEIDFGDNSSMWANDGECDDPRFEGPGMTETMMVNSDRFADASDCRAAFEAGSIWLAGSGSDKGSVDFGDNSSMWANDGECDDPRFTGPGMTETTLLDSDRFADANDCRVAFMAGTIRLK